MIDGQSIPCRRSGLLGYRLLDETVIYDVVSSQAVSLNETAGLLWELCDGTRTVKALSVDLAARFDVEFAEVDASVREAVQRLCDLGLVCL